MNPLDTTDRAILHELQADGRVSNVQLAERVHLSESACLRHVRLLEESGVIDRFTMIVNQAAVGLPGNVFAEITLTSQKQEDLDRFEEAVRAVPEIMECYL
ncbi:MAG: Lrp/AsnC family transcriptional regulator, partial [Gammaproteobacteria bacterium]